MANREIEARLKLSAVDKTSSAFKALGRRFDDVTRKAERFNAMQARMSSTIGMLSRFAGPAILAYGLKEAITDFAEVERRMNRIGITADATKEQTAAATQRLHDLANQMAISFDGASQGLDVLVSSGQNLDQALAFLPAVLATAQATGAEVGDVANTALKTASALKLQAGEMQAAFDIMVTGGKAGQFEMKDMAQYIPQLANSFSTLGYSGQEGLKQLIAILQTIREDTGSAEQAATDASNVFGKIYAPATAIQFKKLGVDLNAELSKARANGEKTVDAFVRLTAIATKGDLTKLSALFPDKEMREGMTSLLTSGDALKRYLDLMNGADVKGTVFRDLNRILDDTQSKIQRLSNSWDTMVQQIGASGSQYLAPMMDRVTKFLNDRDAYNAGVEKLGDGDPTLAANTQDEFFKQLAAAKMVPTDDAAKAITANLDAWNRANQAVGRGETDSVLKWIRQESLRTDSLGILHDNYSKYRPGKGQPNPLNAQRASGHWPIDPNKSAPWDGVVPIPAMRPTEQELHDAKVKQSYDGAGTAGRELVAPIANQYSGEAALNKFYGTSKTPQQVIDHMNKMKKRFPNRYKEVVNPEALGTSSVVPDAKAVSQDLQTGAQSIKDGGHEAGQSLMEAGDELARKITAAAAEAVRMISSAKVSIDVSGLPKTVPGPAVKANLGSTADAIARSTWDSLHPGQPWPGSR